MSTWRKKPVEIEAWQVGSNEPQPSWLQDAIAGDVVTEEAAVDAFYIETLEGTMRAGPGDWIIRGVAGELYPCKPDIFAQTYEAAA